MNPPPQTLQEDRKKAMEQPRQAPRLLYDGSEQFLYPAQSKWCVLMRALFAACVVLALPRVRAREMHMQCERAPLGVSCQPSLI